MSAGEILLIFFVALMLFGSKSLPGFAKTLGKAYREFKRASDDIKQELTQNAEISDLKREIESLRNDVTGNFSGIRDSISTEVNRTKNTVIDEVATVKTHIEEPSINSTITSESNPLTDPHVDSDYQHEIYKEAADKAYGIDNLDSTVVEKDKVASVSSKIEEQSVSSINSPSQNN